MLVSTREAEDRLLKLEEAQRRWDDKLSRLEKTLKDWQVKLSNIQNLSQTSIISQSPDKSEKSVLDALTLITQTDNLDEQKFMAQLQEEIEDLEKELYFLQRERREIEMGANDYE
jgi:valyl-tRNA synthetase